VATAAAAAAAGAQAPSRTYRGLAVHKPGEEFKQWEYQAGPLNPKDVEIKVGLEGILHSICLPCFLYLQW
jgi:hypothetical protein